MSSSPAELCGVLSGDPGQPRSHLSQSLAGPSLLPFSDHMVDVGQIGLCPSLAPPILAKFRLLHKEGGLSE